MHSRAPSVWHARCVFYAERYFHDAICFYSSAIQSEHHSGCILVVRTEMQYVLYQRKIELRTQSMGHLLSSVVPVLCCDTNRPTHAPTVLSLASSADSVCASSLGPLRIVRCVVLLHRAGHLLYAHYIAAAALLIASFLMLGSVL